MRRKLELILLFVIVTVFVWSAIGPADRFTWFLEVAPVLIGLPVLLATRRRFPLSMLLLTLLTVHAVILMVGGHYTYAEVPLFNWIRDHFGLTRNHYDRVGHFAQGFIPAILAREVLLRNRVLRRPGWLGFVVVSICLAFSAIYELIEWSTAALSGTAAEAFLGTQGDVWDTQKDMALALIGATAAMLILRRAHDASMRLIGFDA